MSCERWQETGLGHNNNLDIGGWRHGDEVEERGRGGGKTRGCDEMLDKGLRNGTLYSCPWPVARQAKRSLGKSWNVMTAVLAWYAIFRDNAISINQICIAQSVKSNCVFGWPLTFQTWTSPQIPFEWFGLLISPRAQAGSKSRAILLNHDQGRGKGERVRDVWVTPESQISENLNYTWKEIHFRSKSRQSTLPVISESGWQISAVVGSA